MWGPLEPPGPEIRAPVSVPLWQPGFSQGNTLKQWDRHTDEISQQCPPQWPHTHKEARKGHPLLGDTVFYPVPRDAQAVCEILAATTHAMDAVCHAAMCHTAAEGPCTLALVGTGATRSQTSHPDAPALPPRSQGTRLEGSSSISPDSPARASILPGASTSCPGSTLGLLPEPHTAAGASTPSLAPHRRAGPAFRTGGTSRIRTQCNPAGCSRQPAPSTESSTQTLHPGQGTAHLPRAVQHPLLPGGYSQPRDRHPAPGPATGTTTAGMNPTHPV